MKVTGRTREVLAARRYKRDMAALGYRESELEWRIHRGDEWDQQIIDVKIAPGGKSVWYKIGKP